MYDPLDAGVSHTSMPTPAQKLQSKLRAKRVKLARRARPRAETQALVPSAIGTTNRWVAPRFGSAPNNGFRVSHREFVGDIYSSTTYNVVGYPMNPGLSLTFPWLAAIAANFEKYKFVNMCVQYRSCTNTGSLGSVVMMLDFDAADPPPANKPTILNSAGCIQGNVWNGLDMPIDCRRFARDALYVRVGALQANQDVKTYDGGNLFVGVADGGNALLTGSLFIEYTVDFFTPQVSLLYSPGTLGGTVSSGSTSTNILPFGTNPTGTGVAYGCGLTSPPTGTQLFFGTSGGISTGRIFSVLPVGQVLIGLCGDGTTVTSPPVVFTGHSHCSTAIVDTDVNAAGTSWTAIVVLTILAAANCWLDLAINSATESATCMELARL